MKFVKKVIGSLALVLIMDSCTCGSSKNNFTVECTKGDRYKTYRIIKSDIVNLNESFIRFRYNDSIVSCTDFITTERMDKGKDNVITK